MLCFMSSSLVVFQVCFSFFFLCVLPENVVTKDRLLIEMFSSLIMQKMEIPKLVAGIGLIVVKLKHTIYMSNVFS